MNKRLSTAFTGIIAVFSLFNFNAESLADTPDKYFCGTSSDGVPTTFVRRITGKNLALIRWERDDIKDFPPQKRCQLVSENFEKASKNGYLGSITGGFWKGNKVICATKVAGGRCLQTLFTIKPNDDPDQVIKQLINVAAQAKSTPVPQSNGTTRNYYSMEDILKTLEENEEK